MLVAATSVREYFQEALKASLRLTSVQLTEAAQAYLVYLLSEFARSDAAFAGTDQGESPTLAALFSRAQEAEPEEALRIFKHMGDSALYLLGFFGERIDQQAVSPSYYVTMGESAYSSASSIIRVQAVTTAALYSELADRFMDLVALFNTISIYGEQQAEQLAPGHLIALLERYQRTGNTKLLELLRAHGVLLSGGVQ